MSYVVNTSTDKFSRGQDRSGSVPVSTCLKSAGLSPESSHTQPKAQVVFSTLNGPDSRPCGLARPSSPPSAGQPWKSSQHTLTTPPRKPGLLGCLSMTKPEAICRP